MPIISLFSFSLRLPFLSFQILKKCRDDLIDFTDITSLTHTAVSMLMVFTPRVMYDDHYASRYDKDIDFSPKEQKASANTPIFTFTPRNARRIVFKS